MAYAEGYAGSAWKLQTANPHTVQVQDGTAHAWTRAGATEYGQTIDTCRRTNPT